MYNIDLFIGIIVLLVANNADIITLNEDPTVTTSLDSVIMSIRDAELAGADVSDLTNRFNIALNLKEQADKSTFNSCSSREDCIERANIKLVKIIKDAELLKEHTKVESEFQTLIGFTIYAPLTAFATSIVGYCSFKGWRSYQVKRYLAMEIRKK